MKKKVVARFILFCLIIAILFFLSARRETLNIFQKEGIKRVSLSKREEELLSSISDINKLGIYSYKPSKEARQLDIEKHTWENGTWKIEKVGGISIGSDPSTKEKLRGILSVNLNDTEETVVKIDGAVLKIPKESNKLDGYSLSTSFFLDGFKRLELGKGLPLSLEIHSKGSTIKSLRPEDYLDTDVFENDDFVEVIVVNFSRGNSTNEKR